MATTIASVDAVNAMKNITMTVKVKRTKELAARLWIGKRLIALAAWVMNVGIEVEEIE